MISKVIKIILIIFWMGLIFSFSSDTGSVSTKKSDGLIINVIESIYNRELSSEEKEMWTSYLIRPVRKGAHLVVYLILGILILSFVNEFMILDYRALLLSLFVSFLYACSDEIHQLMVPGRSGQLSDVILDTVGSGIGILLFTFIMRKWKKYEQKERVG